ncbi:hypothetical protein NDU88_011458 [Pleurodeles waltl]|uniref:Uncharacterized protein n=1 Tax=Pleurodeles waltl TaxID=8319 RepID=A0AAV7QXB0_PLEWA|nr:hypothetical protein NDU88_011458 [Pleurodeles waltl]
MIPFAVLLESQVDSVLLTRVGGVPLVLGGSVGTSAPSSSDGRARGRRTSYHWFSLGSGERPPLLPRVGVRGEGGPVTIGSRWAVGCVRPFFLGWACEGKADQLPLVSRWTGWAAADPPTAAEVGGAGDAGYPAEPRITTSQNESRAASPPKQALRSVLSRNPDACKNTVEKLMDTADTPQKEQPTKAFGRKPTRARCHPKK